MVKFYAFLLSVFGGIFVSCLHTKTESNQLADYAEQLMDSIIKYYQVENIGLFNENYPKVEGEKVTYLVGDDIVRKDKVAYLWPFSGLFSAANALADAKMDTRYDAWIDSVFLKGLKEYYDCERSPAAYQSYLTSAGHSDRFYDDNIWLGIDFIEYYSRTNNAESLKAAETIWSFLESGNDANLGGGIYWCEQKQTSKNTCSNAPAAVLALKLYEATGNKLYLKDGTKLYHWTKDHLQDTTDGLYMDNIKLDGAIDSTKYAYNSGQMLQASVLLYSITGEGQYRNDAHKLARACYAYFFHEVEIDNERISVPKEGNVWFMAVLMRGYEELYHADGDRRYMDVFRKTLELMWSKNIHPCRLMDNNRFLGGKPQDTHAGRWLLTQAAIVEMYARLSLLD